MNPEIEVEVFRAGDYGPRGSYSEADLEKIAADYSPTTHEAPVTVDHRQEGPALGWVRALRRIGSVLVARLGGLAPDFLEQLRSGAFKKRSVELYRAAEWTGRPYLRALSFLGACAPAVKGLADPLFAEGRALAADVVLTDDSALAETSGHAEPSSPWIDFDESDERQDPEPTQSPQEETPAVEDFRENTPPVAPTRETARDTVLNSSMPAARDACEPHFPECARSSEPAQSASNCVPLSEPAQSSEPTVEAAPDSAFIAHHPASSPAAVRFCEQLRNEGRLLPAWEQHGVARFLAALDDTTPVHFAESPDSPAMTLRAWFQEFLQSLPVAVPMGETAMPAAADFRTMHEPVGLANRRGVRVDEESIGLHQRVLRYLEAHPRVSYSEALRAVAVKG